MVESIRQLLKFRSLIWALTVRHLGVRYRGSTLGFLWSFLNPLCLMLVYLLVFKYYVRFEHDNYTVFLLTGLLPWIWLQSALIEGTSSISSSGSLITKSMFPALVLPTVSLLTSMIHFLLSLPLLLVIMFALKVNFHWTLLLLPLVCGIQFVLLLGIILISSSLNVFYRDVQHLIANLLTFMFFLCPILYPITAVPERFRFTLELNPLATLTVLYHNVIIDGVVPSFESVVVLSAVALLTLWGGTVVYNRNRESFAEAL